MGLYERLLQERDEEQQPRGRLLVGMRGLGSKVLVRRLEGSKRRPQCTPDLLMMHQLITKGPRNAGEGMRLGSLKARYRKEHAELRAEELGDTSMLPDPSVAEEIQEQAQQQMQ